MFFREVMFMECKEIVVDARKISEEDRALGKKMTELLFRLNHTMPMTEEYSGLYAFGRGYGKNQSNRQGYKLFRHSRGGAGTHFHEPKY